MRRRADIEHSADLSALAARLRALATPLLEREITLPAQKPLLSQDGGVCPADGSRLVFDPYGPHAHRCPECGDRVAGERHDRAWAWRFHLWLSERCIHLALLGTLLEVPALATRARELLEAYAALYPTVPNRDNVLGPTRLFFSTYLESIWLTQTVIAASLLDDGGEMRARLEPVVRESAGLVASFDEGIINRQVWNDVALIAAGRWLGEDALVEKGSEGRHGLRAQLLDGVTPDGLWFEGENYHFFALRGLLLGAELLDGTGVDLYGDPDTGCRLAAMYVAPLQTVLPDLTLPARGDAPFGVSLRQPRFAELFELGWRRTGDPRLAGLLHQLYGSSLPVPDDGGAADIAEQEVNRAPGRVTRDALSWKALLWMDAERPPPAVVPAPAAALDLPGAGIAVLRPSATRYVSVECGGGPGGHGHPDQLHLTLFDRALLLGDFGAGSYVNPSLHWYRSTLAHNAPGWAGRGQEGRDAWCAAMDVRDGWAWCRVEARELFGPTSAAARSILTGDVYTVDVVEVSAADEVLVDLSLHPLGAVGSVAASADRLRVEGPERVWEIFIARRSGEQVLEGVGPGPPTLHLADGTPLRFLVRRAAGSGRWVQVYARDEGVVRAVRCAHDAVHVRRADGREDRITVGPGRAAIETADATVVLQGVRSRPERAAPPAAPARMRVFCPVVERAPEPDGSWEGLVPIALDRDRYRRAEAPYGARGPFAARVALYRLGDRVGLVVRVAKRDVTFRAANAVDPALDNETPEIHSDGIQCYLGADAWEGYVVVPEPGGSDVRVRAVEGTAGDPSRVDGRWAETPDGYAVCVAVRVDRPLARGARFPVNVVVNEMYPERQRRAGQLVLSGGVGTVYLRGDREDPASAAEAEVT